ncbi:MAG TPA: TonB-dependent receptor [Terriglobales bacterium]|nr:TonB-dependent receptor [Terriglobales bacterium]
MMEHAQLPAAAQTKSIRVVPPVLFVLFTLILFLSPRAAQAQVLYGSMTGNVTDSSGAAIAGAKVEALDVSTGVTREEKTDNDGTYRFNALQPGVYKVTISAPTFASAITERVDVVVNNLRRLDARLKVASQAQDVTVTAEPPLLQTDKADVHTNLSAKQIEDLPIGSSQGRNFQSLYKLVPGSGLPTEANSPAGNPQRSISVSTNGQSIQTNSTRIDGAADQYPWLPQNVAYIPPADAIETVNITSNAFDAEQGQAGGTAVNVQIKSGTNQLHGSGHEYYNDAALNAKNFFFNPLFTNPLTGVTGPRAKPKNVNNQFGGTIGGPIKKDKLFFFGDYERTTQRAIASSNQTVFGSSNSSLPDYYKKLESGDFSGFVDKNGAPIHFYDPATGHADGTGRSIISCNGVQDVICANRMDPAAVAFLKRVPAPNVPETSPNQTSNYFALLPTQYTRDTFDTKINYNPTNKSTVFGRYSFSQSAINDPPVLSDPAHIQDASYGAGGGAINGGSAGIGGGRIQSIGLGATYAFTPNLLADWNLGFTRQRLNAYNFDLSQNVGLSELGIPGTNGPDPLQGGIPAFLFSGGYSTMGNSDTGSPFLFRDNQWVTNGNLSWNHGKHALRFGVEADRAGINHFQPQGGSFGTARGSFRFTGAMTANPGSASQAFSAQLQNGLADFLLGLPAEQAKATQTENPIALRWTTWSAYARDQFQITQKLTVNFGVRWEFYPFPTSDNGRGVSYLDPDPSSPYYGSILVGGVQGIPRDDTVSVGHGMFLPRLGVAYRLREKTVIRAGYGMSSDPNNWRFFRNNYPNIISTDVLGAPTYPGLTSSTNTTYVPAACLTAQTCNSVAGLYPGLPLGVTQVPTPDISNTAVLSLVPSLTNRIGGIGANTVPRDFRRGYINSFNLTLQQEFAGFVLDTGYVGATAIRPLALIQLNVGTIGGGQNSAPYNQLLHQTTSDLCPTISNPAAKCGTTLGIGAYTPWKNNYYDSWQTKLTRHFGSGSQVGIVYTWQHAISYSDSEELQSTVFTLPQYYYKDKASSSIDRTHNFEAFGIYELPFGRGKRWATSGIGNILAGGWQLNSIFSHVSGNPFSLFAGSNNLNAPGSGNQAVDQIAPQQILGNLPRLGCSAGSNPTNPDLSCYYFNPLSYTNPPGTREGNTNRNTIRGPGFTNLDLSVFRTFKITERFNFQFQAEAFGITNTPHFLNPGGNTNGTFSAASNAYSNATGNTFGVITSTLGGRQGSNLDGAREIFFAGKLIF